MARKMKRTIEQCLFDHTKDLKRVFPWGYGPRAKEIEIKRRYKTKEGLVIEFENGKKYVVRIDEQ